MPIALGEYTADCEGCKEKARYIAAAKSALMEMYKRVAELEGAEAAERQFGAALRFLGIEVRYSWAWRCDDGQEPAEGR